MNLFNYLDELDMVVKASKKKRLEVEFFTIINVMEKIHILEVYKHYDALWNLLQITTNTLLSNAPCLKINRYPWNKTSLSIKRNVASYEHLPCPSESAVKNRNGEWMHANQIEIFTNSGEKTAIVASQQPNREGIIQFLSLICNGFDHVIDLRSHDDMNEFSSIDYVPIKGQSIKHSDYLVATLDSSMPIHDVETYKVKVIAPNISPKYFAVHQYRHWKDHDIVLSNALRALRKYFSHIVSANNKVLVHCRAGIGRTGSLFGYISIYNALKNLADPKIMKNASFFSQYLLAHILKMRSERGSNFIETKAQFELVMQTLLEDFVFAD